MCPAGGGMTLRSDRGMTVHSLERSVRMFVQRVSWRKRVSDLRLRCR
jgi:hypothetical protein